MEKTVWKLLVNAVFGKTMENLRHRKNMELIIETGNNKGITKLNKLVASHYFASSDIIQPDKVLLAKTHLKHIKITT
jgi:hypothetical protein